jgi:hypothetical protein
MELIPRPSGRSKFIAGGMYMKSVLENDLMASLNVLQGRITGIIGDYRIQPTTMAGCQNCDGTAEADKPCDNGHD